MDTEQKSMSSEDSLLTKIIPIDYDLSVQTLNDIDRLLSEIDRNRREAIAEVNARFDNDLAVLKRAKQLLNQTPKKPRAFFPEVTVNHQEKHWPGFRHGIRDVINDLSALPPGEFTLGDIMEGHRKYIDLPALDRAAVSTELWKMAHFDPPELIVVKAGKPNVYKKAERKE
jgi:hypothetical protein